MDSSLWFDTIKLSCDMVHNIYRGVTCYNFQICIYLKIVLSKLANSIDTCEMLHIAEFHLSFHFCQSTLLGATSIQWVNILHS